jgi:hypothetical protein
LHLIISSYIISLLSSADSLISRLPRIHLTCKGKEREGHGNRHVDTDLPNIYFMLKLTSSCTTTREIGRVRRDRRGGRDRKGGTEGWERREMGRGGGEKEKDRKEGRNDVIYDIV